MTVEPSARAEPDPADGSATTGPGFRRAQIPGVAGIPPITPVDAGAVVTMGAVVQDVAPGDDLTDEQPDVMAATIEADRFMCRLAVTPAVEPNCSPTL